MRSLIVLLIFIVSLHSRAQDIISSNTSIEACREQGECVTVNGGSYLFYDESKNEFYLKVDFGTFRSRVDSLNGWLNDIQDSTLYFKAILTKESFPPLTNQETKTFILPGQIYFNDVIKPANIEITIFGTENSLVISGNNNLRYDAYKVNFFIPVVTKDYKAYKKLMYLNQTISVNLTMGRINLLRPGMELHLKEVYYQGNR